MSLEERLRDYLEKWPVYTISKLEKEAGIPAKVLHKWLKKNLTKGSVATLSEDNQRKLRDYLEKIAWIS